METSETLRRKIENAGDLRSLVRTMKTLALVNIRHYEDAVESLEDYFGTVERGFQALLRDAAPLPVNGDGADTAPLGVVVIGSEQGMVGQFNERIASFAQRRISAGNTERKVAVLTLGARVASHLTGLGYTVEDSLSVPNSVGGINAAVAELLVRIEAWRSAERGISHIHLIYNRTQSGASYSPSLFRLLPLDGHWLQSIRNRSWESRSLPIHRMDWETLFAALVHQYLFVGIYRAIAESLASENASRLVAMQAAEQNIEDRLEELRAAFQQQRQTAIMNELLDVISGYVALTDEQR